MPFFQKLDEIRYLDWISIRKTITLISALVLGLFILTNLGYIGMLWGARHMDSIVEGRIINRKDNSGIIESRLGNRTGNISTEYEYEYKINGNLYSGVCYLTSSFLNMKKLTFIRTSPLPVNVEVKYDRKNPYNSTIWLP